MGFFVYVHAIDSIVIYSVRTEAFPKPRVLGSEEEVLLDTLALPHLVPVLPI